MRRHRRLSFHQLWWVDITPSRPDAHDLRLRGAARVGHLALRILSIPRGDGTYGVTEIDIVCDTQLHVTVDTYRPRDKVSCLDGTLDEALHRLRLTLEGLQQEIASALVDPLG